MLVYRSVASRKYDPNRNDHISPIPADTFESMIFRWVVRTVPLQNCWMVFCVKVRLHQVVYGYLRLVKHFHPQDTSTSKKVISEGGFLESPMSRKVGGIPCLSFLLYRPTMQSKKSKDEIIKYTSEV